eukprot:PITA_02181
MAFQNFIMNMKLVDTKRIDGTFTWNNKRGGAHQVASKLDRFMISKDLFLSGPTMTASILLFGGSYHWPKLKHIKSHLKVWNKNEFGDNFKAKRETELKLQEINQINITYGFTEERKKLTNSLQEEWENRCLQEEIYWRQKSRIQWIKEGERNTKFFHKTTMAHRAHNRITKIKDSQGIELVSHNDMESVLVQHFCNIAKEPLEDRSRFIDHFTQYIPQLVTREDNHNLNRPVSKEEVIEVINEM